MAKPINRQYRFSDGTLRQYADSLKISVTRDAADFTPRGITASQLTGFQTLINTFDGITTDEELLGRATTATEEKEAARKIVEKQLRNIRGIADAAYNGKGLYKSFGFEDMTRVSDGDLYRMSVRIQRVASEQQADLIPHGLTDGMLSELQDATNDFDVKIDNQVTAQRNRDLAAQERIGAGNNLFAEVQRFVKVGKSIYQDIDEARYNDYLLPIERSGNDDEPTPPQE